LKRLNEDMNVKFDRIMELCLPRSSQVISSRTEQESNQHDASDDILDNKQTHSSDKLSSISSKPQKAQQKQMTNSDSVLTPKSPPLGNRRNR